MGRPYKPQTSINQMSTLLGEINVTGFTANSIEVNAKVSPKHGAWLIYADSFHPGWLATVNGKSVQIAEANLAFKAVKLEQGENQVKFKFSGDKWGATLLGLIALIGLMSAIILLIMTILLIFKPSIIIN